MTKALWVFLGMFMDIDPLRDLIITPEMLQLIAELDESRGRGSWYESAKPSPTTPT